MIDNFNILDIRDILQGKDDIWESSPEAFSQPSCASLSLSNPLNSCIAGWGFCGSQYGFHVSSKRILFLVSPSLLL